MYNGDIGLLKGYQLSKMEFVNRVQILIEAVYIHFLPLFKNSSISPNRSDHIFLFAVWFKV